MKLTQGARLARLSPWLPLAVIVLFGFVGIPWSTWITLSVAGLGMGMMLFVMATGLSLSFGLMDVLNLGHGALIAIGGFIGATAISGYEFGVWPALPWLHWHPGAALQAGIGLGACSLLAGLLAGLLAARAVPRPRERRRRAALPAGAGLLAAAAVALALGSRQLSLQPLLADLGVVASTFACAFVVLALVGLAFEYLFIRPVYRDPLRQILVTVGASYLIAELLKAVWGPASLSMGMPSTLVGGLSLGGVVIEKYRLLAAACGLLVYLGLQALVHRTRAGLLIRAGVENVEMVEALGYRVRLLFLAVFVGGAALAGLGGAMWGLYQGQVGTGMGAEMLVMIIIVVIMGGLGSISGCLYASVLVGLLSNYTTYIVPTVSLFSSIGLLVVVLLAWPRGLLPAR